MRCRETLNSILLQQRHIWPVAMQVIGTGGAASGPTSSSVCHSGHCDWRWQGEGATKPMSESGGEEEGVCSGR